VDGLARTRPASPAALAGEAIGFASLYLSAGALMPLLVVYQGQWHFPSALLTLAFAVFAVGFLAAVLTVGSLSDYLGRRPVLLAALLIQLASNVVFLTAPNVGWVIAGRIVQGLATGAATPAFTAALVELAPPSRKGLGTVLGSVGLTGGLAVGSLLAGLAIQFTTDSNAIVFTALTIITVFAIGVVALAPETVTRKPATLRALIPRVSVPLTARAEFAAAAPVIAAVWMGSGLSGGLAPSMVKSVFGVDSGLLSGLSGFVSPAMSAVVGLAVARMDPRRAMTIGILATILGGLGIASGPLFGSLTVMIVGQTIAGAGFGASFAASLRLILPLAAAHQRATAVASIYLVSYLAFGAPIVIAGQLVEPVGLVPTVFWYTVTTVLLALIGLRAQRSPSPRIADRTGYEHID
jgi:MFS family permease